MRVSWWRRRRRAAPLGCYQRWRGASGAGADSVMSVGFSSSAIFDQFCLWIAGSWSCQLSAFENFEPCAGSLGARSFKYVPGASPSAKARPVKNKMAACRLASVLQAASALPAPALVQQSSTCCETAERSGRAALSRHEKCRQVACRGSDPSAGLRLARKSPKCLCRVLLLCRTGTQRFV